MTADQPFNSLRSKHESLEREIDKEVHRPLPDELHLAELKRKKLRVKDQMASHGV